MNHTTTLSGMNNATKAANSEEPEIKGDWLAAMTSLTASKIELKYRNAEPRRTIFIPGCVLGSSGNV